MAHPKKVWDYKFVEETAAAHKKSKDVFEALGTNTATFSKALRTDEEFRTAYNRGRSVGGFKLYQPTSEASNGNGHLTAPKLDGPCREVLELLQSTKTGLPLDSIESGTGLSRLEVSNAIRTLAKLDIVHFDGASYSARRGAPAPKAAATHSTDRPQRKSSSKHPRLNITNGNGAIDTAPALTNGHGSTARAAKIMEQARVELLYQRAHGEASPKFYDVIEALEKQLVDAVAGV